MAGLSSILFRLTTRRRLAVARLVRHGPNAKPTDGYFRFQCPHGGELRVTVNPKNNVSHCFSCGENTNNIDLMMHCGHDFLPAVMILEGWLEQYRRDLGQRPLSVVSSSSQPS